MIIAPTAGLPVESVTMPPTRDMRAAVNENCTVDS